MVKSIAQIQKLVPNEQKIKETNEEICFKLSQYSQKIRSLENLVQIYKNSNLN